MVAASSLQSLVPSQLLSVGAGLCGPCALRTQTCWDPSLARHVPGGLVAGTVAGSYLRPLVFLSFVFICVHIFHLSGMFSFSISEVKQVFLGKCVELWS